MNIDALRKTLASLEPAMRAAERADADLKRSGILRSMDSTIKATSTINANAGLPYRMPDHGGVDFGGIARGAGIVNEVAPLPVMSFAKTLAKFNASQQRSHTGALATMANPAHASSLERTIDAIGGTARTPNAFVQPQILKAFSALPKVEPAWTRALSHGLVGPGPGSVSVMPKGWAKVLASRDVLDTDPFGGAVRELRSPLFPKTSAIYQLGHVFNTWSDRLGEVMRAWQPAIERVNDFGRQVGGIFDTLAKVDWEAFRRGLRVLEARRPRTKVGFAALDAYDSLYLGRPWKAEIFLVEYLRLPPNEYTREALWLVLRSAFENISTEPKKWLTLEEGQGVAYLRKAVWNEAWRIRRDREMEDRIWWPEGEREEDEHGVKLSRPALRADNTLELWTPRSPGPEQLVIPPPPLPPDDRPKVIEKLELDGTPRDQRIAGKIRSGEYEFKDLSKAEGPSQMLSFQRKARRWRKNGRNTGDRDG